MKNLNEIWAECIDKANQRELTRFILVYEFNYYYSEWRRKRWSEPVKVINLSYLNLED